MIIILDAFPVSSTGKHQGEKRTLLDECRDWVNRCEEAGHTILVPAICYYEALRELELRQATSQIARLQEFCLQPQRFVRLTTSHLEAAVQLWGRARRAGKPTADVHSIDGDVILAAQALSLKLPPSDYVIASTNPGHLKLFVPCDLWTNITP